MGEQYRGFKSERIERSYYCINGHVQNPQFAAHIDPAEIPDTIDCPNCGLPAGQDKANPPQIAKHEPYKTHLAYVKERRTPEEAKALLEEALSSIRDRRARLAEAAAKQAKAQAAKIAAAKAKAVKLAKLAEAEARKAKATAKPVAKPASKPSQKAEPKKAKTAAKPSKPAKPTKSVKPAKAGVTQKSKVATKPAAKTAAKNLKAKPKKK